MFTWLISTIIVGLAAGWIANKLMSRNTDDIGKNLCLGLVGSFVGSLCAGLIGIGSSNIIGSIVLAVIGAVLFTFVYEKYIAH